MKDSRWPGFLLLALLVLLLSGARMPEARTQKLSRPQQAALTLVTGAEWEELARSNPLLLLRINAR